MVDRVPEPHLDDIYREIILDHYRRPRNRALLDPFDVVAEGVNPFCGDKVKLTLRFDGDRIAAVGFRGSGCAISQSSASLMTESIKDQTRGDAARMKGEFEAMLVDGAEPAAELGDLDAFHGVAKLPVRVKCALLAWKTLGEALARHQGQTVAVSIEV